MANIKDGHLGHLGPTSPLPPTRPPQAMPAQSFPRPDCQLARNHSAVFRWYSGDLPPGTLTVSSCGYTYGDPVLSALSSPSALSGPFACVGCAHGATDTSLGAGALY